MRYLGVVDFRYLIPPVVCLYLMILWSQDKKPWSQDRVILAFVILFDPPFFIFLVTLMTILFVFISVKLPFTLTLEPIRLKVGDFSLPLLVSMVASLILPPHLFFFVFPILIVTSRWFGMVLVVFKIFLRWLYHTLQYIPILIIGCTIQRRQGEPGAAPPQVLAIEFV
ncbi:hypothetical protein CIPAW_13G042400 [Carya illinoinensis]|uniref:Uncharacterized protein n=1 Tax=Carya illinoinensis TaxID=32201 RepID=A0A8T1NLX3_CARIL|nr:hypothetical protein CIPAW_13G042400 [Carya illinoinensis]